MATRWFVHEAKKARQAEGLRVSCFDTPEDLLQAWAVVENRWQCWGTFKECNQVFLWFWARFNRFLCVTFGMGHWGPGALVTSDVSLVSRWGWQGWGGATIPEPPTMFWMYNSTWERVGSKPGKAVYIIQGILDLPKLALQNLVCLKTSVTLQLPPHPPNGKKRLHPFFEGSQWNFIASWFWCFTTQFACIFGGYCPGRWSPTKGDYDSSCMLPSPFDLPEPCNFNGWLNIRD